MRNLVSIVIPAFNHERFVALCLNSVLESDYPDKEIVIIDDGSSDRTAEVIQKWIDQHKKDIHVVFRSRNNKGISATLNEGIALAKGEFVLPLASDDALLPNGLTRRVNYLNAHPELGAVFGDCHVVDENGNLLYERCFRSFHKTNTSRYKTPRGVSFGVVWHWALPGSITMLRRSLYSVVGGYDERRKIEDWDFFLRLAARDALGYIDIPVAAYRIHTTNTCIGKAKQAFIVRELAESGFRRAHLFSFPMNIIVLAKASYYALKAFVLYLASFVSSFSSGK
jgi:glycosyltransferase involved in cell wall biosynthesis